MKTLKPLRLALCGLLWAMPFHLIAQNEKPPEPPPLTDSQIQAIAKQLEELQETLKDSNLKKNGSAEQVFKAASSDPKKALELYLKCYQEVNFNSIGKSESDFRDWRDSQEEALEMDTFVTGLQLQLLYLSLAARAAQQDDISKIFGELTNYVAKLQTLSEPPHPLLSRSIANTVFAEVYDLNEALNRNGERWELQPLNIGGIYEKTILPFLRTQSPEKLDTAWNSRIQQEGALAALYLKFEDEMERYERREGMMAGQGRQRMGEMMRFVREEALTAAKFQEERQPALEWLRARDQFLYVNRAFGAKAMLDHIQENLTHPDAERWIQELQNLTASPSAASAALDANT